MKMNKKGDGGLWLFLILFLVIIVVYNLYNQGNPNVVNNVDNAKQTANNAIDNTKQTVSNIVNNTKQTINQQTTTAPPPTPVINTTPEPTYYKVANWNLQIFGVSKAAEPGVLDFYANKIDDYDIIFVQEIRDASGDSFRQLCAKLPAYNCKASTRAGTSSTKEQYGLITKKNFTVKEFTDYNTLIQFQTVYERPPVKAVVNVGGYDLTLYNIHTDPDKVVSEMASLKNIVVDQGNAMLLGDLNADCTYYTRSSHQDFTTWNWLIGDNVDTTVASTDCAYDRIIVNDNLKPKVLGAYVDRTIQYSDHYLVYATIRGN